MGQAITHNQDTETTSPKYAWREVHLAESIVKNSDFQRHHRICVVHRQFVNFRILCEPMR